MNWGASRNSLVFFPSPLFSSSSAVFPASPCDGDTNKSLALQALYANNAVKRAFSDNLAIVIGPDDDDDDDWEDNMDPNIFARYYAAPWRKLFRTTIGRCANASTKGIANWIEAVQSEDGAS